MGARLIISCLVAVCWSASALAQPQPSGREAGAEKSEPAPPADRAEKGEKGEQARPAAPAADPESEPDAGGQPPEAAGQTVGEQKTGSEPEAEAGAEQGAGGDVEPGRLKPPTMEMPEVELGPPSEPPGAEPSAGPGASGVPTPGEAGERLTREVPESVRSDREQWTAPQPVLTLHGYFRVRGELQDTLWLGREAPDEGEQEEPFTRFIPLERDPEGPTGGCGDESTLSGNRGCDVTTLQFANLRLRLAPQLNLSEDVRVKMMFDMLDNIIAGTTPATFYGNAPTVTREALASTDVPPDDSIVVRRAWAEVRNRDLGELRFGRMPNHWGLGILYNAGEELDEDFSSDVDRLMGVTNIYGIYLSAAYDFISDGYTAPNYSTGLPSDVAQMDDVDQFTFAVWRRLTPEQQDLAMEGGDAFLNGGILFSYRVQDMYTMRPDDPENTAGEPRLGRIDAETFTVDGWGQFRWRGLRLELETALVAGTIGNIDTPLDDPPDYENYDILELGAAFETEYRLLDEKLGLHFKTGLATGDSDVRGLSSIDNLVEQTGGGETVSTFRFHPSYRIDLILWRSIMRQITGAYYFKPGINYDFVRSEFGQLFGAQLDVIISRACAARQTWGRDQDLGVEINTSLYWRSEDGPEMIDGYHALVQWGILFPMHGLSYPRGTGERPDTFEMEIPQTLRLLLGVVF
jgi:uncharacterized protein (TIGR04551 family)